MPWNEKKQYVTVVLFAAAMAWTESATVAYLRTWLDRIDPYQAYPLAGPMLLGWAELVREAATLVMLSAVAWLAGHTARTRLGYFLLAFGVWDILYYGFLKMIVGWPDSLWDWDVLFLLPLPWWGPVIAPLTIAALMVVAGTLLSQFDSPERPAWPSRLAWLLGLCGGVLALFVFMADALAAAPGGAEAVRSVVPSSFDWPLFALAVVLMAAPVADLGHRLRKAPSSG